MVQNNGVRLKPSENGNGNDHEAGEEHTFCVERSILQQEKLQKFTGYRREKKNVPEFLWHKFKSINPLASLYSIVPVLEWLPKYSFKDNLIGDTTAGVTVAVMHIPQGMAFSMLSTVEPIVGLYMAFFHSLIYFVFGTSRHLSVGTFAVVSLMVANIISGINSGPGLETAMGNSTSENGASPIVYQYSPIQIATAVSMVVGIYQIVLSIFRMGALSSLLSDPLVKGFTTAAAIHVIVSQLKDLLGLKIPLYKGAFNIVFTIAALFESLGRTNLVAMAISFLVIVFMLLTNDYLKPYLFKKYKFPLPSELIAVVGGVLASKYLDLGSYDVSLIGSIPTGLPTPAFPPVELFRRVAVDSVAIAIVSYTINISMAFIFAKRQNYEIRANQELLALGMTNVIGANFSCLPNANALSRSIIQEQTGGKTQVAGVITALLILVVLLWIGPFFEPLPKCVLAAIIVMALKGMLNQLLDLKNVVKEGIIETSIWVVTFVSVVLIDLDIGLLLGVVMSIGALYIKGWKSYYCLLGTCPDLGVYVDLATHKAAIEVPDVKIFRYSGAINFATRAAFKQALYKTLGDMQTMKVLIIDLSFVLHLDAAGCKCLADIRDSLNAQHMDFFLAGAADCVYDALQRAEAYAAGQFQIFSTVHDGVSFAHRRLVE